MCIYMYIYVFSKFLKAWENKVVGVHRNMSEGSSMTGLILGVGEKSYIASQQKRS